MQVKSLSEIPKEAIAWDCEILRYAIRGMVDGRDPRRLRDDILKVVLKIPALVNTEKVQAAFWLINA